MSNISIFANNAAVPAFARNNTVSDLAKALIGNAFANVKRISIKGGVFRLLAGGKEVTAIDERFLDVIIVKAAPKVSRIFYMATYDSDVAAAPDCSSADGEKPDAHVKSPQHTDCMTCPQNIAGSGQKNSRACRFQQRLAVVQAADPEGDVLQLSLPSTSIFGKEEGDKRPLQAFVRYLSVQNPPINPEQIVTRMRFDTSSESPKLFFQPMRWLTEDEYEIALEKGKTKEAEEACQSTPAAVDGVTRSAPLKMEGTNPAVAQAAASFTEDEQAEPPAPAPKTSHRRTAKVEEPTDVEVTEVSEPEVRKAAAKPTPVAPANSALAAIVADWDDEG